MPHSATLIKGIEVALHGNGADNYRVAFNISESQTI